MTTRNQLLLHQKSLYVCTHQIRKLLVLRGSWPVLLYPICYTIIWRDKFVIAAQRRKILSQFPLLRPSFGALCGLS